MRTRIVGLAMVVVALAATSGQARQWTDNTGTQRREAEFVRRDGNRVWFTAKSGRSLSADFQRLSAADQAFIVELERRSSLVQKAAKPRIKARTLAHRAAQPEGNPSPAVSRTSGATASPFRLADWCASGHCYVHPHPLPPAPPTPPLPRFGKRIYHGAWSTWHLLHFEKGPNGGTGSYLLNEGGHLVRHLVLLSFDHDDRTYWYFQTDDPNAGFRYWRFSNRLVGSCWYSVEYSADGQHYYVYEYCCVKLPV